MLSISMLDVCLKLFLFEGKKMSLKWSCHFGERAQRKNVGFALLKKSEELFLELTAKLSARARGGDARFVRRLCHPSENVAKPMKSWNLHSLSRDWFDSSSW